MSTWQKVDPQLAARFDAALPRGVERRSMFGCPCAFVHGNMFAGLHENRLIVRVPEEAASRPCVIMGRTMKQYALIPDALALAPEAMRDWIARGHAFTRALPPKAPKKAKKK
jgi:TfoX/Sxy family transcriptional regulator of competence genes